MIDRLAVIFPFEEGIFNAHGRDFARYVGHPLVDALKVSRPADQTRALHGFSSQQPLLVLMPGSRRSEVALLLPAMLAAANLLKADGWQVALLKAPTIDQSYLERVHGAGPFPVPVLEGDAYNLIAAADAGVIASGTATLEAARVATGAPVVSTQWQDIVKRDDVHAVIIATPNFLHPDIAIAAARTGKHILCEKPIALNAADARVMASEADRAGVRHMTAFTYQFVPAMRYLRHLIAQGDLGRPYHYRSCRLQDWGTRNLGWRQQKRLAGTGELGDMLSHRIDFAHQLVGPIRRMVARRSAT
jgi:hypothetical protein